MREPTMTLQDIERMLEIQNREFAAFCAALTAGPGETALPLPVTALEHIRDVCSVRLPAESTSRPGGIRC